MNTTQAGDWWEARQRGERLPEHEDLGDTCELCFRPMRPDEIDRECVRATGFVVCAECIEAAL